MKNKIKSTDFSFSKKKDVASYLSSTKRTPEQRMRDLKFEILRYFLKPYLSKARVLDLGCGSAFYCNSFLEDGAIFFVGIDKSRSMIDLVSVEKKKKKKIKFIVGSMLNLKKIPNFKFDIITSIYSLMRIKNISKVFKNVQKRLKKKGIFVVMSNTYLYKKSNVKKSIIQIKKNGKIYLNNYPRSTRDFIEVAEKNGFILSYFFCKPFSEDKIIVSCISGEICGFDTIFVFQKI